MKRATGAAATRDRVLQLVRENPWLSAKQIGQRLSIRTGTVTVVLHRAGWAKKWSNGAEETKRSMPNAGPQAAQGASDGKGRA